MLEIIHDLAPGAALFFHGSGGGVASHIAALNNLAAAGVRVIAEDIPFDAEPAFQKGAAATAGEALRCRGHLRSLVGGQSRRPALGTSRGHRDRGRTRWLRRSIRRLPGEPR